MAEALIVPGSVTATTNVLLEPEVIEVGDTTPERNLWNAVILQFFKDLENVRRELDRLEKIMNDPATKDMKRGASGKAKRVAFNEYTERMLERRMFEAYMDGPWFRDVCFFADHEPSCVISAGRAILEGEKRLTDKQVKRTFTRKPNRSKA